MRCTTLVAAILLLWLPPAQAAATSEPAMLEWAVPWPSTRPRDPFTLDGRTVWFCGQVGHYLARLDTTNGQFAKVELPDLPGPHNVVVDAQGIVWYAGNLRGYIGRFNPASGSIEKIRMPDPAAVDPHTLVFDARGNIWFTVQGGNFVGRLATTTRKVELVAVPTPLARPYGIAIAPDGRVWSVLFNTNRIATIDPATLKITEVMLPRADARPRRLAITRDGRIWYADHAAGNLGAYDPAAGTFSDWPMPGGADSRPYAMAVDDADRLWIVETGVTPNRMVGFDPARNEFFGHAGIPSGAGSVRHMQFHAATRTLWFGTDANTIGRLAVPAAGR